MAVGNPRCTRLWTLHGAEAKTNAKYAPGICWIHPAEGKRGKADRTLHVSTLTSGYGDPLGGPGAAWKTHVGGEMLR